MILPFVQMYNLDNLLTYHYSTFSQRFQNVKIKTIKY